MAEVRPFFLARSTTDAAVNTHEPHLAAQAGACGLEYVPYPRHAMVARYQRRLRLAGVPTGAKVFVGHVPGALPQPYLAWALDTLLEEYAVGNILQTTQNGCAKLTVRHEEHRERLIGGGLLCLFDVCGVWFARTPAAVDLLNAHAARVKSRDVIVDERASRHPVQFQRWQRRQTTVASVSGAEAKEQSAAVRRAIENAPKPFAVGGPAPIQVPAHVPAPLPPQVQQVQSPLGVVPASVCGSPTAGSPYVAVPLSALSHAVPHGHPQGHPQQGSQPHSPVQQVPHPSVPMMFSPPAGLMFQPMGGQPMGGQPALGAAPPGMVAQHFMMPGQPVYAPMAPTYILQPVADKGVPGGPSVMMPQSVMLS